MKTRIINLKKDQFGVYSFGYVSWTEDDLRNSLQEFCEIYQNRPIKDNIGGMRSAHCFYIWFLCRRLAPKYIIESGVWRGQGTWLLRQSAPDAEITSIDPRLRRVEIKVDGVRYLDTDFSECDWSFLEPSETLVLFDDHQHVIRRLRECQWFGFRDIAFDDNFPKDRGDCYSPKQVLEQSGFRTKNNLKTKMKKWIKQLIFSDYENFYGSYDVEPNQKDRIFFLRNIDVYYEFPPIFKSSHMRWNDLWQDDQYPTKRPLFEEATREEFSVFEKDARMYNWLCYIRLNR